MLSLVVTVTAIISLGHRADACDINPPTFTPLNPNDFMFNLEPFVMGVNLYTTTPDTNPEEAACALVGIAAFVFPVRDDMMVHNYRWVGKLDQVDLIDEIASRAGTTVDELREAVRKISVG
jgi:hypothetical protein